jgi:hypothetical protein
MHCRHLATRATPRIVANRYCVQAGCAIDCPR